LTACSNHMIGLHGPTKYRPDIDGLRAIAVTSVVAYHCSIGLVKGGFVGVDVFFVISGYLIGLLVYKEIRGGSFSIAKFYVRRAKRILPALFGVLIFCYLVGVALLSPMELHAFAASALATITSTSNIFFFFKTKSYFSASVNLSPLLMTWSLGVEEQFYIFFPLLMLLLRKKGWRLQLGVLGALAVLSLLASIYGTIYYPGFTFYQLPTRAWELAIGVLLAMFESNRAHAKSSPPTIIEHALGALGLVLIGIAIFGLDRNTSFPGCAALLPVAGAALIIAARQGITNRILSWRPIVFIGLISYSWYLWHWPMLSFARIISYAGISETAGVSIGIVSFGCAVLSYKFVEQPFRRSATTARLTLVRYGTIAVIMMIAPAAFYISQGLPSRNREAAQTELPRHPSAYDWCLMASKETAHPLLSSPCLPVGGGPMVALIGDSHAGSIADALRAVASHSGYKLVELEKMSCPPLVGASRYSLTNPTAASQCNQFNRERMDFLKRDSDIRVVVAVGFWDQPFEPDSGGQGYQTDGRTLKSDPVEQSWESLRTGLDGLVSSLEQSGKTV